MVTTRPEVGIVMAHCGTGTQVGKIVALEGKDSGVFRVVHADAHNRATVPAFGVVISKPTASTCLVRRQGEVVGLSGLNPGSRYFCGQNGEIAAAPPTPSAGGKTYAQAIGVAISSDTLLLDVGPLMCVLKGD